MPTPSSHAKPQNWRSLSAIDMKSFRTAFGDWRPCTEFGALALIDNKESSFCILQANPWRNEFPIQLSARRGACFPTVVSGLKCAYLHLLLDLQVFSAILPPEYDRIAIEYSPHVKNHKMTYTEAWDKWSHEHPGKQPLVEAVCLVRNDGKIFSCKVSHSSVLPELFSLPAHLGFMQPIIFAIIQYNMWLNAVAEYDMLVIPLYFFNEYADVATIIHKELPVIDW